jgi:hypothetical protein
MFLRDECDFPWYSSETGAEHLRISSLVSFRFQICSPYRERGIKRGQERGIYGGALLCMAC